MCLQPKRQVAVAQLASAQCHNLQPTGCGFECHEHQMGRQPMENNLPSPHEYQPQINGVSGFDDEMINFLPVTMSNFQPLIINPNHLTNNGCFIHDPQPS